MCDCMWRVRYVFETFSAGMQVVSDMQVLQSFLCIWSALVLQHHLFATVCGPRLHPMHRTLQMQS
jgi:hypothetical protein